MEPIFTDDRGNRKTPEGEIKKFPVVTDDVSQVLMARITALEAQISNYKTANDQRTITGGGSAFSGTFGSGIIWNPNAAGVGGSNPVRGFTGDITVCVSDGMGGFTQQTAHFSNGVLISVG